MGWTARDPGLAGLSPSERARLDRLPPARLPAGSVLFHPGDAARGFVVVLSGQVSVYLTGATGRDILLYHVTPGQSCVQTTLGLLGGVEYTAEAVADTDVELVLVPRPLFLSLLDDAPAFRALVFRTFAERMRAMMQVVETVAFQRLDARLAGILLGRADRHGVVWATHQDLASALGTAREVISRKLEAMAQAGHLRPGRGRVEILDADALRAIALGRDD